MDTPEIVGTEEGEESEMAGTNATPPVGNVEEIAGVGEESEENEIAGEEEYSGDLENDLVGFSFKKFRKKIGKVVRPLKKIAPFVAPVAAFHMLARARVKPLFKRKIATIKRVARTPPQALVRQMKDEQGNYPTLEEAELRREMAQQAWENLQAAAEVQEQAYEDFGDYDAYDPYESEFEESMEGEASLYEWGAAGEMDDLIGFSFKKLARKLGRTVDPTKKGSPFRAALQSVPGIGPQLTAAADMVAKARAGAASALNKIEDVKKLAAAGDPKGKEALANLQAASALAPKLKLHRFFERYEYGARVPV